LSGLDIFVDGDFLKARNTTLGADNGIAVAMILTILESHTLSHPPIEAIFTVDEEIGMLGALDFDCGLLSGKRMINLDSEEDDTITVSCAGGREFEITVPVNFSKVDGNVVEITISGLKGGHSGVEIHKGRVNANILAGRILNHLYAKSNFQIVSVNGGDKSNAITLSCEIKLCSYEAEKLKEIAEDYFKILKNELNAREPDMSISVFLGDEANVLAINQAETKRIINLLATAPCGVIDMSAEIDNLVETSLNLGILKTLNNSIVADFSLRSNKTSALDFLVEKLTALVSGLDGEIRVFGHYPPWEFKNNSKLQEVYLKNYIEHYGVQPKVSAIHAGLECGVFASKIKNLECIAVGPNMFDVHTINEKLSISSTKKFFQLLLKVLKDLK